MAGHVNLMDDCLISNLPPAALRSALRLLVSQGASTQQPFVEHIRSRFYENPPHFDEPEKLFPGDGVVSEACLAYLAQTRCIFSCKLSEESFPYLRHFLEAIPRAKVRWTEGGELAMLLAKFDGDIVQAVQALKESSPELNPKLSGSINSLLANLGNCRWYCEDLHPPLPFPFARAMRQVKDVLAILFPEHTGTVNTTKEAKLAVSNKTAERNVMEKVWLGSFPAPRLFNGLWQVSSPSWGSGSAQSQEAALLHAVEHGLNATDMADHYGDAELIYGDFRSKLASDIRSTTYAATKWCIFSPVPKPIATEFVLDAVRERCRRLRGRVDLLQFHWYNYEDKAYLNILVELVRITRSHAELVSAIGLCNFDSEHVEESCKYLIAETGSVGIISNQVQFSLVDARPLRKMTRYFDMILSWGTWKEFQALLEGISTIAHKHGVSLTNIATRWVLQQPAVGAVIVGTRLGISDHVAENLKVFEFELDDNDMYSINGIALGSSRQKVTALFDKLGDCGNEYRKMH
ncbi:aldo/keto reductase [Daldinia bambusicola]|nr:aldo/keto reductase [Daldinia bambusicola]